MLWSAPSHWSLCSSFLSMINTRLLLLTHLLFFIHQREICLELRVVKFLVVVIADRRKLLEQSLTNQVNGQRSRVLHKEEKLDFPTRELWARFIRYFTICTLKKRKNHFLSKSILNVALIWKERVWINICVELECIITSASLTLCCVLLFLFFMKL